MVNSRIEYLIERVLQNTCTLQEKMELAKWIEESSNDDELKLILGEKWIDFEPRHTISHDRAGEMLASILKKEPTSNVEPGPRIGQLSGSSRGSEQALGGRGALKKLERLLAHQHGQAAVAGQRA